MILVAFKEKQQELIETANVRNDRAEDTTKTAEEKHSTRDRMQGNSEDIARYKNFTKMVETEDILLKVRKTNVGAKEADLPTEIVKRARG